MRGSEREAVEILRSRMDPSVAESLQALERTAAWVNQVAQMRQMSNFQDIKEDSMGDSNPDRDAYSDKDFDDIPDSYEGLQVNYDREAFESSDGSRQADAGSSSTMDFVDIPATVQEFKAALESSGISQRFAAKFIMDSTSQGNLSFLLEKGKSKHWSELSCRGRLPYIRMRRWLDSPEEQRITLSQLSMTKEFKKTGPKDGSGRRGKFTLFQLMVLCRFFEEDQNPSLNTRMLLAEKLLVSLERITIWFQNQRARGFPAKRVLCLMSVDRQNAESEKAEFGRKYKNIQDDIQKRTQALTGALQNMAGTTAPSPTMNGTAESNLSSSYLNGLSTETQNPSAGPRTTDLSSAPGSVRSLSASSHPGQRYKPYDIPPVWGNGDRYGNFTNYLLQQTTSSASNSIQNPNVIQSDESNASMKKELGDLGINSTSGRNLPEKSSGSTDPRPAFLVQNMVNSSSVFSRPYPHNAYQLGNIGQNGVPEKEGITMTKSSDFQIPIIPTPKMSEMETTSSKKYDKQNEGSVGNISEYGDKSNGPQSLRTMVKEESKGDHGNIVSSLYSNHSPPINNSPYDYPMGNHLNGHVNFASVKLENVEDDANMSKPDRITARPSERCSGKINGAYERVSSTPSLTNGRALDSELASVKREVDRFN